MRFLTGLLYFLSGLISILFFASIYQLVTL